MSERLPKAELSDQILERLFDKYAKDKWNLADRGYIAGVHPLELWLVDISRTTGSQAERGPRGQRRGAAGNLCMAVQDQPQAAQDTRIRILIEPKPSSESSRPGRAWAIRSRAWCRPTRPRSAARPTARRARRADGHHRQQRRPPADGAHRAPALRRQHAVRDATAARPNRAKASYRRKYRDNAGADQRRRKRHRPPRPRHFKAPDGTRWDRRQDRHRRPPLRRPRDGAAPRPSSSSSATASSARSPPTSRGRKPRTTRSPARCPRRCSRRWPTSSSR